MHNYSFGAPVVTVCALFTDRRTDRLTDGRQTSTDNKSLAELKALICAITMSVLDVEMKIYEKIPETHVIQWEIS